MTDATIAVSADASVQHAGEDVARSLASDAWRSLKKSPLFWVSVVMITVFVAMAVVPQLFTSTDPNAAVLQQARQRPGSAAWFGRDIQGYDIYSRVIYGARASILVGVFTTLFTVFVGATIGIIAGFYGGFWDSLVSRITDIFFAIPFLLGAILFMATFPNTVNSAYLVVVLKVVIALGILGWPSIARLMRSSVLQVKPNDYVQAARALGASPWRIIRSHVLPNAMAPVIVVSMINLGAYIAAEATLSFLGLGLVPPAVSWGVMISDAIVALRTTPHILLFPSLFLSLAVLAFIMLGDAVRDAFDPKTR
jgi:oligopeptide transport system permease protein